MRKFISLSGRAGSGKDTFKQILIDHLERKGLRAVPYSFADPIKDACTLWFGWDRQRLSHDFKYKEGGLGNTDPQDIDPYCARLGYTRREIMQLIGTECMRENIHQDFWIILADLAVKLNRLPDFDVGILPDARFLNELKWVQAIDGCTIHVKRLVIEPGQTLIGAMAEGTTGTLTTKTEHASEKEFETFTAFDVHVLNVVDKNIPEMQSLINQANDFLYKSIPSIEARIGL